MGYVTTTGLSRRWRHRSQKSYCCTLQLDRSCCPNRTFGGTDRSVVVVGGGGVPLLPLLSREHHSVRCSNPAVDDPQATLTCLFR